MTDVARQPELQVMRLSDTRVSITGPLPRVNTALSLLREEGRLVTTTDPQPTADGGVLVTVKVLSAVAPQPPVGPAPSAWTPRIVTILAAIVGTVLISCGVMALHGLAWVGAHRSDPSSFSTA